MVTRVDRGGVLAFCALSFTLAWVLFALLWLDPRHLEAPHAKALLIAAMFAPALATFAMVRWIRPSPETRRDTGLVLGRRWLLNWLLADVGTLAFVAGALVVGWGLRLLPADPRGSPLFPALAAAQPRLAAFLERWPHLSILAVLFFNAPIAPLANGLFAFGEEWGWRGWLLPKLLPLGRWNALLASGAIWGAWHAPLVALGYNYPQHRVLAPLLMICFCVVAGVLFGWTRLATGSVWPAVVGHAALNSTSGALALLGPQGSFDTAQATILGWSGWLLPLAFIGWLVATRRLSARPAGSSG